MLDQIRLTCHTGHHFLYAVHLCIEVGGEEGQVTLVVISGQPLCYVNVTMVGFKL